MAGLTKKNKSCMVSLVVVIVCLVSTLVIFRTAYQKTGVDLRHVQQLLEQQLSLLSRKQALQMEWAETKKYFTPVASTEEAQTRWFKSLLDFAQAQGIKINKLDPAGVKPLAGAQQLRAALSFDGDIRMLTAFLYHLLEAEPLTGVETFAVRLSEGKKHYFTFELTLSKVIP